MLVRVEASHFLWKMVRRMVGVIVEVGLGAPPAGSADVLRNHSHMPARVTAPARDPSWSACIIVARPGAPCAAWVRRRQISKVSAMTERLITCPACGSRRNRLPPTQPGRKAVCGKCKASLPATISGPVDIN